MWRSLLRSKICLKGYPIKIPWCQEAAGMLLVGSWNMGDEAKQEREEVASTLCRCVCVCDG